MKLRKVWHKTLKHNVFKLNLSVWNEAYCDLFGLQTISVIHICFVFEPLLCKDSQTQLQAAIPAEYTA